MHTKMAQPVLSKNPTALLKSKNMHTSQNFNVNTISIAVKSTK